MTSANEPGNDKERPIDSHALRRHYRGYPYSAMNFNRHLSSRSLSIKSSVQSVLALVLPICWLIGVVYTHHASIESASDTASVKQKTSSDKKHSGSGALEYDFRTSSGVTKSISILNTATATGRFVLAKSLYNENVSFVSDYELDWTNITTTHYQVPGKWAHAVGYSDTLVDAFHQQSNHTNSNKTQTLSTLDRKVMQSLHGKTLLIVGDSTTDNIFSTMCHCTRGHNNEIEIQGPMYHDSFTECYNDHPKECVGPELRTCKVRTLNLTIHHLQGEYVVHPYGPIPFGRGQHPECQYNLNLSSCLRFKWNESCNTVDSLKCMSNSSCVSHRPPDMIFINTNYWFWFRKQWFGKLDELDYDSMTWADIEEAFMTNMTTAIHTVVDYFNGVKLIALETSPGTKTTSRVALKYVMHINSAIRSMTANLNAADNTVPVALLELEHMGHLGWNRDKFLFDDMHPQFAFNNAVSNILLNALASL